MQASSSSEVSFQPLSAKSRGMSGFRQTVHEFDRSLVVSEEQKAVRRGDVDAALFCAMELIQSQCTTRLINRLITMVSEDVGPAGGWLALLVFNTLNFCYYPTYNAKKKSSSGDPLWRLLRDSPSFCGYILAIVKAVTEAPKSRFGDNGSMAWYKWREEKDGVSPAFSAEVASKKQRIDFAFQKFSELRTGYWIPTDPSVLLSYFALLCEAGLETTESLCVKLEISAFSPSFRQYKPLLAAIFKLRHLRSGKNVMKGNCTISHAAHLLCFPEMAGFPPSSLSDRLDALPEAQVAFILENCKSRAKNGPTPFVFPSYAHDMHTGNFELSKSKWLLREDAALSPRLSDPLFQEWDHHALTQAHIRCAKWENNGWMDNRTETAAGKKRSSEEKKPKKKRSKQEQD